MEEKKERKKGEKKIFPSSPKLFCGEEKPAAAALGEGERKDFRVPPQPGLDSLFYSEETRTGRGSMATVQENFKSSKSRAVLSTDLSFFFA